ncbi:TRAP transporter substrate-binding protein DctP [Moorella sulfitireducens (nom. illeg.)]|uniref:TRAP transporter substrate-binding protein DctP n=1 Tax=Neomoorella sulfitireducens TaxID=2972948 RepID=UPI0021ACEFE6|nr:TRAP transporter substrate-binding protein DctP [Moorella sulfitireducens]
MKRKILALLLALSLVLVMLAGCNGDSGTAGSNSSSDPAETFTLIVSLTKGQKNTTALQDYLASIEKDSNGRIKFEIFYSGSLLKVPEIPQGLTSGVCDISEFILAEFPTIFPLNSTILGLPFIGMSQDSGGVYRQLLEEFPEMQEEYTNAGMVMLNYLVTLPYNLHLTTDREVKVPSDLRGLKIITTRKDIASIIQDNGGAPVSMEPGEYYSSMEKGVVDGTVLHFPMMFNAGLIPLCKQHVMVSERGGIYSDISAYVMSANTWNKLPADLQALFTDEERVAKFFQDDVVLLKSYHDKSMEAIKENGNKIVYLTDEEIAQWQAAAAATIEASLAELDAQGLPATQIYERALELIAEANS